MRNLLPALLALPLLGSCVTSGDLRELAYQFEAYENGDITREEMADAIDGKVEEVEERTEEMVKGGTKTLWGTLTGNPTEALLGLMALGGGAYATSRNTKKQVHAERDQKYKEGGTT